MVKIHEALNEYEKILSKKGYTVAGIFLYGSQNYHMETEVSDIDVIAAVLPDYMQFAYNDLPNEKIRTETGEIKVKDLRLFAKELLKGCYSTLETLISPYSKWTTSSMPTVLIEDILNYDLSKTFRSCLGTMTNMKQTILYGKKDRRGQLKEVVRIKHLHQFCDNLYKRRAEYFTKESFLELLDGSSLREWKKKEPDSLTEADWQAIKDDIKREDSDILNKYRNFSSITTESKQRDTEKQLAKWVTQMNILHIGAFG